MYLVGYSMVFSTNGKSFMLRKSSPNDPLTKEMSGSSFTVVTYQLVEHPTIKNCFSVRRMERMPDGTPLPSGSESDDRVFKSLLLRDMKFDMIVRLEQMSGANLAPFRTFVRVSVTSANYGAQGEDPRVYFLSNLFEVASPEFIHNRTGQVGFARRFIISKWNVGEVLPGIGYQEFLPPQEWADIGSFSPFKDYVDKSGVPQDMPVPPATGVANPFDVVTLPLPPLRYTFVKTGTDYLSNLVGKDYHGRILGQITPRTSTPGTPPAWVVPISLDVTPNATQPVMAQLNNAVGAAMGKGYEAVEDLGHTIFATAYEPGTRPDGSVSAMVTDTDAKDIIAGK